MSLIDFRSYIKEHETVQSECDLTVNELKEAFFSLKIKVQATMELVLMSLITALVL